MVPLGEIVNISKKQDFSIIKRRNGFREISITAEINENILNPDYFFKDFQSKVLKIEDNYKLQWKLAGRSEEQVRYIWRYEKRRSFSFRSNLCNSSIYISIILITNMYYGIIPFILIGVILGHWITGFDITILSLVAMLGLGGIVVNDSIILVSNIYEKINSGKKTFNSVIQWFTRTP